jgi:hypothetical protein
MLTHNITINRYFCAMELYRVLRNHKYYVKCLPWFAFQHQWLKILFFWQYLLFLSQYIVCNKYCVWIRQCVNFFHLSIQITQTSAKMPYVRNVRGKRETNQDIVYQVWDPIWKSNTQDLQEKRFFNVKIVLRSSHLKVTSGTWRCTQGVERSPAHISTAILSSWRHRAVVRTIY